MHATNNVVQFPPSAAKQLTDEGARLLAAGNPSAIDTFLSALEFDHRNPIAWNGLGVALFAAEDLERAEHAFSTALQCDGDDVTTACNLGRVYARQGRWAAAASVVVACLQHENHHPDALALMQIIASDPSALSTSAKLELAKALCWAGELPPAAEILAEAATSDPTAPVHKLLVAVASSMGDVERAIAAAKTATRADSAFPDFLHAISANQGDFLAEGALSFENASIPVSPTFFEVLGRVEFALAG